MRTVRTRISWVCFISARFGPVISLQNLRIFYRLIISAKQEKLLKAAGSKRCVEKTNTKAHDIKFCFVNKSVFL